MNRLIKIKNKDFVPKDLEHLIFNMLLLNSTESINPDTGRKYTQRLGVSRSVEDMYMASKYYFGDKYSEQDVRTILSKRELPNWMCSTHKKRMFRLNNVFGGYMHKISYDIGNKIFK